MGGEEIAREKLRSVRIATQDGTLSLPIFEARIFEKAG